MQSKSNKVDCWTGLHAEEGDTRATGRTLDEQRPPTIGLRLARSGGYQWLTRGVIRGEHPLGMTLFLDHQC